MTGQDLTPLAWKPRDSRATFIRAISLPTTCMYSQARL